jgi:hypothetical protein
MALQKRPYSILDRSSRDGYIEFNGGSSMLRCHIRFSSESGANLEFESVKDIPTRFLLYVGGHSPAKKCVVMWKISTIFGVEFE